jgi:predicted dinucleotide-binding enzyme
MYNRQSKIGIIGSGVVGQVLAKAFRTEGNAVQLGTRDTGKTALQKWAKENSDISLAGFEETAAFGDIIVLAVSGDAAESALQLSGVENLSGKLVIDATNPISKTPPVNGVLNFFTDYNNSLMESLQSIAPDAKFVKAFNSVGNALMYKPQLKDTPTMFIAGNDKSAKADVTTILTAFGWETADMGAAEAARAIEPLCILWCIPGFIENKVTAHAVTFLIVPGE